jgi:integrase
VTGARRAEIAAFQWNDLDGDRLTIDSSAVVQIVDRQRVPVDAPTKTANRRTVRPDAPTVELFGAQRTLRESISRYLFSLDLGPANPDRIGWWWHRARELSGIDKRWRLHDPVQHLGLKLEESVGEDGAEPQLFVDVLAHW